MIVEVGTLVRPERKIVHKSIHREHYAELGGTLLCLRVHGLIKKRGCVVEEIQSHGVIGLATLELPAPPARLKDKADAAPEEIPGLDHAAGVVQTHDGAVEVVFAPPQSTARHVLGRGGHAIDGELNRARLVVIDE